MTMSPVDLDRTDFVLLALLQKDGRLSNKDLAARVGLAPSSCHARVQRLLSGGALRGFHGEVDPALLGIGLQAVLGVVLARRERDAVAAFRSFALARPEVIDLYHLAGSVDLLLHVAVRDAAHLRTLVLDQLASRPEVARLDTSLLFEHHRADELPRLV